MRIVLAISRIPSHTWHLFFCRYHPLPELPNSMVSVVLEVLFRNGIPLMIPSGSYSHGYYHHQEYWSFTSCKVDGRPKPGPWSRGCNNFVLEKRQIIICVAIISFSRLAKLASFVASALLSLSLNRLFVLESIVLPLLFIVYWGSSLSRGLGIKKGL